jgi:CHAT domain-containing protein
VLHVATHSFYDLRCPRGAATRSVADLLLDPPDGQRPVAGLALAGANRSWGSPGVENDGIVTVSEIAALDLSHVEWVVLSACETALGQVASGEGVLGLARGFQVAGARSLVLSLWPAEDRATREWMTALYRARFVRGETPAQAIHSAGLEVLARRRRDGETTHPLFWAGFIGVGGWN